jgi:hypothetical protein
MLESAIQDSSVSISSITPKLPSYVYINMTSDNNNFSFSLRQQQQAQHASPQLESCMVLGASAAYLAKK